MEKSSNLDEIRQDVHLLGPIVSKLDKTMDKLSDAVNKLSQIAAVQDNKIHSTEKLLEKTIEEHKIVVKDLASANKEEVEKIKTTIDSLDSRTKLLEKLVWMSAGAGGVIGWILNYLI